jgi:hypothetical protein
MTIHVIAPGRFEGEKLKVGCYYNAEPAAEGTDAQNKTFHALLQEYWRSGCHSYNARSFAHFRALIKLYLGAGVERFCNVVNENGTPYPQGRTDWRLKSWSDYTKAERMSTIDNLISEMFQAGVNSKKFHEILKGMEERG